jgi:hypothetical protein
MARRRTANLSVVRTVTARPAAPIIKVTAPRAVPVKHKRRSRRSSSSSSSLSTNTLMGLALGSVILGYAEQTSFVKSLPTIPMIGKKGTLAVATYFLAKNMRSSIARDVCIAATVLAAHELGGTGRISGDDDYDDEG